MADLMRDVVVSIVGLHNPAVLHGGLGHFDGLSDTFDRHVQHQVWHSAVFSVDVLKVEHHEARVLTEIDGADNAVTEHARSTSHADDGHRFQVHDQSPRLPTAIAACSRSSRSVESFPLRDAASDFLTLFQRGTSVRDLSQRHNNKAFDHNKTRTAKRGGSPDSARLCAGGRNLNSKGAIHA